MTREQRLELLKQIEKDIYVCSLESTLLEDAKSCAIHSAIDELEQEPKTGHWIISPNDCFVHCSECGLHGDKGIYKHYGWCPNCGAKMDEPQESEGKE